MSINLKRAYQIAKKKRPNDTLVSLFNYDDSWGFLFEVEKNKVSYGNSIIHVLKSGFTSYTIPMIPENMNKINSGKKLPLSMIK